MTEPHEGEVLVPVIIGGLTFQASRHTEADLRRVAAEVGEEPFWRREDDPEYALADVLGASWAYADAGPFKFHLAGAQEILEALAADGWVLTRP